MVKFANSNNRLDGNVFIRSYKYTVYNKNVFLKESIFFCVKNLAHLKYYQARFYRYFIDIMIEITRLITCPISITSDYCLDAISEHYW